RRHARVPRGVPVAEPGEHFRVAVAHVRALARVGREVVEKLVAFDGKPLPPAGAHRALLAELHAPEELPLEYLVRAAEVAEQARAVEGIAGMRRDAGRLQER